MRFKYQRLLRIVLALAARYGAPVSIIFQATISIFLASATIARVIGGDKLTHKRRK